MFYFGTFVLICILSTFTLSSSLTFILSKSQKYFAHFNIYLPNYFYYRFINLESLTTSSSTEDGEEDEYLRDGNDYGNTSNMREGANDDNDSEHVMETAYIETPKEYEPDITETNLNTTINSAEAIEPTTSLWEDIMGLVEDINSDSKLVDVSNLAILH